MSDETNNIQHLPRLLPVAVVAAAVGYSRVHIQRLVRAGQFPAPVQLGPGRIAFRESDVAASPRAAVAAGQKGILGAVAAGSLAAGAGQNWHCLRISANPQRVQEFTIQDWQ